MILNLFKNCEAQFNTTPYELIIAQLPTDIENFELISFYLSQYSHKFPKSLILLIYNLSISPFTKNFVKDPSFLKDTLEFLVTNLNKEKRIDKYIYKIIAQFIQNYNIKKEFIKVNTVLDLMYIGKNTTEVEIFELNDRLYYRIMKELACLGKYNVLKKIVIEKENTYIIKRLKIKILSHQDITIDHVNHLLSFLNDRNTQLGWTLGKALVRIITCHASDDIVNILVANLTNIFAHETLWINTAHIFSFLILKGIISYNTCNTHNYEFILKQMIPEMIYYNTIDSISEQVRESGLFIMWSLIRKDSYVDKENVLRDLISISLLDFSLQCRRAACTVLLEFAQRNHNKKYEIVTDFINLQNVKRYNDCVDYANEVYNLFPEIKEYLLNKMKEKVLQHENSAILAKHLVKHYKCLCHMELPDCVEIEMLFGLISLFNEYGKANLCEKCIIFKHFNAITQIILKNIIEERIFNRFVRVYIDTMGILIEMGIDIRENLIFLLDKNIYPDHVFELATKIQDSNFKKHLFLNLMRKNNTAYILSNSYNVDFKEKIKTKYLTTLQGSDALKKATVIQSLSHTLYHQNSLFDVDFKQESIQLYSKMVIKYGKFGLTSIDSSTSKLIIDEALILEIFYGLEDYSVYINGDSGYFVRKASFEFISKLKNIELACLYFFRYFVEKSRDLRKNVRANIPLCSLNAKFTSFIDKYEKNVKQMQIENKCQDEEIHFTACFNGFDLLTEEWKEQIIIGFLSTFRNCDGYVYRFLSKLLFDNFTRYSYIIYNFLKYERRYKFLAVYFLNKYVHKALKEYEIEDIIKEIGNNIIKKDSGKLAILIDEIYELKETLIK